MAELKSANSVGFLLSGFPLKFTMNLKPKQFQISLKTLTLKVLFPAIFPTALRL